MGILNRNFLEEGYYVEDSYGDLTKISIEDVLSGEYDRETLYRHDGYSMDRLGEVKRITREDLDIE